MRRGSVLCGVACCVLLLGVWAVFTATPVNAALLSQAEPNSEDLPDVERFDYLFEDFENADTEHASVANEVSSDLTALRKIAPQPKAFTDIDPYVPEASSLSVSVDRGCGSVYDEGDFHTIVVSIPTSGYLTVWSSTDGRPWDRLKGPVWVQNSTIPIVNGYIDYPVGNELLFARLRSGEGEVLETVCHYVSVPNPGSPKPVSSPDPIILVTPPDPLPPDPPGALPLECEASLPMQVVAGEAFRQYISLTNPAGSASVKEVTFFARIRPAGFLPVNFCLPNCDVVSGRLTSYLGTLHPGETTVVRIDGSGPNLPNAQFDLSYSTQSTDVAETLCADASFTVVDLDSVMEEGQEVP